jgi:hypothetical protein
MKNITLVIIVAMAIGIGCKSSTDKYDFDAVSEEMMPLTLNEEASPTPPASRVADATHVEVDDDIISEQMLIKTANINIDVENYDIARTQIDSLVKLYKGSVSSESLYNYDYQISNNIVIRVPSESLDKLVSDLLTIAQKVKYQQIESTDVTEEYIDINSRLKNQRAVERKFLSLLNRTDSIDEILQIESKLAEVRGQIESLEGRIKYLRNRVNLSTINLNVTQKIDFKYTPEAMESFWERFKKSVDKGWKGFVAFLLFLIRLWPLWLFGAIITLIIYRIDRKRRLNVKPSKKLRGKDKLKNKSKKADKSDTSNQSFV